MKKEIVNLREKIKKLADGYRNGSIDNSSCGSYIYDVILAAVEVYKNTDIKLYVPVDNGERMAYKESDNYYIPLFTCHESCSSEVNDYEEVTLMEMCTYAYDNQVNYDLLSNPDHCLDHGISYPELMEYAQKNPKYEGIVLDPKTEYPFGFEGWLLQALMFKGMGAVKYSAINAETGEVSHEF